MKYKIIKTVGVLGVVLAMTGTMAQNANATYTGEILQTAGAATILDADLSLGTGLSSNSVLIPTEETETTDVVLSAGIDAILDAIEYEEEAEEEVVEEIAVEPQEFYGYKNIGIANVDNNLNIRQEPVENGKIVGKLPPDAACEILSVENGWANIKSGKVEGYVSTEFLLIGDVALERAKQVVQTLAVAYADALNIRQEPNTNSEVITRVAQGEELEVVDTSQEGWVKVRLDNEECYVSAEFVKIEEKLRDALSMPEILYGEGVSDIRVELSQYAKQFVGNPYVWGGVSLTKGADCSGFTMSVFQKYGISLSHSSRAQVNEGKRIELSEAKPGDLVFYAAGGTINHVALYIGGGQVVHASSPTQGIIISNVGYRTPYAVTRVLQD